MALVRLLLYAALVYLFFMLAFPQWEGQVYHVASLSVIAGLAVGFFLFVDMMEVSNLGTKLALELAFAAGVALYFGYTLPQKSGKTPVEMWMEGHRPTQAVAREGLTRLGVDPNSTAGRWVIAVFPKS